MAVPSKACSGVGAYVSFTAERTDGVIFFADYKMTNGGRQCLGQLWIDSACYVADCNRHWPEVKIESPKIINLVISTGLGALKSYMRDWAHGRVELSEL